MYRLSLVTLLLVLGSLSLSPASHAHPTADQTVPLPLQTRAADDLLTNASFEIDTDADGIPDGWTGKKTDLKKADKQKCNKPDKVLANTGECAFQFNGNPDGKGSKLQQSLDDTSAIANGSKITLSAFVNMKSAAPATKIADLTVNLSDGSKRKLELRLPASGVSGYTKVKKSVLVTIPNGVFVSDAALTFRYGAASGKYLVDDVKLKVVQKTPFPPAKLIASDGKDEDYFGHTVTLSADGNTALVAAIYDEVVNSAQGTVYVFVRSGGIWSEQQELTASDNEYGALFGASVSLSADGNTALVGAPGFGEMEEQARGAAYVFVRSGGIWTQQQQLLASDGKMSDILGNAVSLSADGNIALISGSGEGAYIFIRTNGIWTEHQKLAVDDIATPTYLGKGKLSANGDIALIGASYDTVNGNEYQGSAYIFERIGDVWTQKQKITANTGAAGERFGYDVSISMDGKIALIGTPSHKVGATKEQGTAYLFKRSNGVWTQQHQFIASDGGKRDLFGRAVSLSADGKRVLIGATLWYHNTPRLVKGKAYLFVNDGSNWSEQKLLAPDGEKGDYFGYSVSLSTDGSTAIIGADHDDIKENEWEQGSAWVFDLR